MRRLGSVTWRTAPPTRRLLGRLRNLVQRGRQAEGGLGRRSSRPPARKTAAGAGRRGQEGTERDGQEGAERQARRAGQERQDQEAAHPRAEDPPGPALRPARRRWSAPWSRWAASSTSTRRPSCPTPTPTSRPTRRSSTTATARARWASTPSRTATRSPTTPCRRTSRTRWSPPRTAPSGATTASTSRASSARSFNNASGNATQGASTITQQYIKILYLTQERSYTRKLKEAILSLKLDREQTKQQILEGYLNTIYFGRGAYGVQAAAQAYFQKDAAELDLKESAALAQHHQQPDALRPGRRQGREEGAARALPTTCSTAWRPPTKISARRGAAGRSASCRSSTFGAPTTSTAARRATC